MPASFFNYNVMKKEAKDMKSICRVFHSALPDLQKNFSLMSGSSMSGLEAVLVRVYTNGLQPHFFGLLVCLFLLFLLLFI